MMYLKDEANYYCVIVHGSGNSTSFSWWLAENALSIFFLKNFCGDTFKTDFSAAILVHEYG
jgi:hypothetical protein